jgi:hypothetical protein
MTHTESACGFSVDCVRVRAFTRDCSTSSNMSPYDIRSNLIRRLQDEVPGDFESMHFASNQSPPAMVVLQDIAWHGQPRGCSSKKDAPLILGSLSTCPACITHAWTPMKPTLSAHEEVGTEEVPHPLHLHWSASPIWWQQNPKNHTGAKGGLCCITIVATSIVHRGYLLLRRGCFIYIQRKEPRWAENMIIACRPLLLQRKC